MPQKRLLTIQDFSCLGRCSLTVALPTISACGVECVAIPTSILSNHTAYSSWTFLDLTDEINKIVDKWDGYKNEFDCIYTGYLSTKQIDVVCDIIDKYRGKSLIFFDPAMADSGSLYAGFTMGHVEKMRRILDASDIVKCNLTEACLLSNHPMIDETDADIEEVKSIMNVLSADKRSVIISGFGRGANNLSIAYCHQGNVGVLEYTRLKGRYHGTGDLFASAFIGTYLRGIPFEKAIAIAHEFVARSIQSTIDDNDDGLLYGPMFEKHLSFLAAEASK